MGRKVKQIKNYSAEQIEALIANDENYRIGVKLFAILQLSRGYSSRELADFFGASFTCTPYEVRVSKFAIGQTDLMQKVLMAYALNRAEDGVFV